MSEGTDKLEFGDNEGKEGRFPTEDTHTHTPIHTLVPTLATVVPVAYR